MTQPDLVGATSCNTSEHGLTCTWKQVSEEVPSYLSSLYNISGKVGEGTYGVVYLAHTKDPHRKLLAIKTFKPGKVPLSVLSSAA